MENSKRDEYGEQVLRRSHEHHAQGRHHDQDIIFASKKLERFDVIDRSQQDQRRCDQNKNLEEDRNPIQDKRVFEQRALDSGVIEPDQIDERGDDAPHTQVGQVFVVDLFKGKVDGQHHAQPDGEKNLGCQEEEV